MDFFSILVYFHWKSAFWVRPCLKTSLWRHTLTDFHDFGISGKRRPYPIPWYQTIILWACQFQVHKGVVTTPLGKPCYKKKLGRTRVKGTLSDSNNIFLWHESEDINKNSWLPKFHLIPILRYKLRIIMCIGIAPWTSVLNYVPSTET